jgi:hypothetical protein
MQRDFLVVSALVAVMLALAGAYDWLIARVFTGFASIPVALLWAW